MKSKSKNKLGVWAIAGGALVAAGVVFYILNKKTDPPALFKIEKGKKTLPEWLYRHTQSVGQSDEQVATEIEGIHDFTPVKP